MQYKIQIDGKTPLMQDNGAKILLPKLPTQRAKTQEFNPVENAELCLYRAGDFFGHPSAGFRSAFVEAAKRYKVGRTSASRLLGSALMIDPVDLAILTNTKGKPLTQEFRIAIFHPLYPLAKPNHQHLILTDNANLAT